MVYIEAFILISILSFLFYKWMTRKFSNLKERGIPHRKPKPLIGNIELDSILGKKSILTSTMEHYMEFKSHKVCGSYSFSDPVFIINDLDLIKKVGIRDFDHFMNHKSVSAGDKDKLLGKHLLALRDRQWKEMRNTLTPSFTGSKMRLMLDLINECSQEGVKYLLEEIEKEGKNNSIELEMKDYFTRFANDVIGTVAFGIKVNSFKDKTNQFYKMGLGMSQFRWMLLIKVLLLSLMPKVMKTLNISILDQTMLRYFHSLVFDAIKYREEHNITRPDMINLLLEARRSFNDRKPSEIEGHATFDDDDLLAQCLIFFLAGFETVSTCLCFTLYELVVNPEVQKLLYEEIENVERNLDGKPLDYESLNSMTYLDMVLSESLRKWPPAMMTDRLANTDYTLADDEGNVVVELKKGEQIIIPIYGLHHDPEYFEDPEKFDPERFSEENKKQIRPGSYLPFGIGPRSCIGNRLALMEIKSILYHLVKNFQIDPTAKTPEDMSKAITGLIMMPKDKFWMKFTPRKV